MLTRLRAMIFQLGGLKIVQQMLIQTRLQLLLTELKGVTL
jgi:hypothetical protein